MAEASSTRKQAFETIYRTHEWGGQSRSGPGSDRRHTAAYIDFLNNWLVRHPDCRDIVEIGCGDWATTRLMRLIPPQTYTGYDIVPEVIARNAESFQTDAIRFMCADFLEEPTKKGDLLIVKDVLQHLSNVSVMRFIEFVLPRYSYALLVNDVRRYEERSFFGIPIDRHDVQTPNVDIQDGGSRPLRLDQAPFQLRFTERFSYRIILRSAPSRIIYVKDALIWTR